MVSVGVEVIDEPLDYNLLLGQTWVYSMEVMFSTYFRMIAFPHQGGIVSLDQLTFFSTYSQVIGSIPLVAESLQPYQHVGIGLLKDSYLMGNFTLPPPDISNLVASIDIISSSTIQVDPWIVLDSSNIESFGDHMSLNTIEFEYEAIYSAYSENPTIDALVNWVDHS